MHPIAPFEGDTLSWVRSNFGGISILWSEDFNGFHHVEPLRWASGCVWAWPLELEVLLQWPFWRRWLLRNIVAQSPIQRALPLCFLAASFERFVKYPDVYTLLVKHMKGCLCWFLSWSLEVCTDFVFRSTSHAYPPAKELQTLKDFPIFEAWWSVDCHWPSTFDARHEGLNWASVGLAGKGSGMVSLCPQLPASGTGSSRFSFLEEVAHHHFYVNIKIQPGTLETPLHLGRTTCVVGQSNWYRPQK